MGMKREIIMQELSPKLKTVQKVAPPYLLNQFPKDFGFKLGKEIVYLLAVKQKATLEGEEWEQIFANCIGAEWKPSNVGLDDVVLGNTAFGAKTVKNKKPSKAKKVRLISGRNSIVYSFGETEVAKIDPDKVGAQVLSIWNERVSALREKYKHVRTIVLLKSDELEEVAVFEFETIRYDPEQYTWGWNENGNLEGYAKKNKTHMFTWQPHGSQFTIIEEVPNDLLVIKIKRPEKADRESIMNSIGFQEEWIEVYIRKEPNDANG